MGGGVTRRGPAGRGAGPFCFAVTADGSDKREMRLSPLGDSAVVLASDDDLDDTVLARMRALAGAITRHPPPGVVDVLPAFGSVAVYFDIAQAGGYASLCAGLKKIAATVEQLARKTSEEPRQVEIPVCYGGEYGPDLDVVAARAGIPAEEVVQLHAGADYRVHAIGFVPGFAYLGGLSKKLATPRRDTPRAGVPAGAVGIGGSQTGVYPVATPGGWNLIGRTPLRLFDPASRDPAVLRAGDHVKFRPVSAAEFAGLGPGSPASANTPEPAETAHQHMADRAVLTVMKAGMLTTVQDRGWRGHRAQGVSLCGAADPFALRLANLLVGNPENLAALEFTLIGPHLRFSHDTLVALCGAQFGDWPHDQPVRVAAGTTLTLGVARHGCRGYLAVAGGIDVPPVLGSRSTYLRAGFGGLQGRALREGDVLPLAKVERRPAGRWHIDERIAPAYSPEPTLRVIRGAQAEEFSPGLFSSSYRVTPRADRMGVRLTGPALVRRRPVDLPSAPAVPGTVQVPPDGQPIILMADAQTIGGYPQIAHVISVDLPLVAQLRPGDTVRFREMTLAEAHECAVTREHALATLREGLVTKFI